MEGRRKKERGDLRKRAEARLESRDRLREEPLAEADALRLVNELRVHQVELELQNEELQASRLQAETLLGQYTELFDFAPIGFLHLNADGAIRASNFAAARLLGAPRTALIGRALASYVSSRDRPRYEALLASVLTRPEDDRTSEASELTIWVGADEVPVRVTAAHLDGASEPSVLVALEDVTARRRAEDGLREEARRKDEFLAALSHELRNPLAPIRNAVTLLQRGAAGGGGAGAALAVLDRQVSHLTHLVDDLLDVTRVARGKVRMQLERLELSGLVSRTVEDHRPGFEARAVELECDVGTAALYAEADGSRIAQVIGNLLANALKFTNAGDRVEVLLGETGGRAVLRVRDTGVGIEPALLGRLFEPFSQGAQTLDRSRGGLGLGLATVKGLVELHGGQVAVASQGPGRGAEFTVWLPLAAAPAATPEGAGGPAVSPRRVLVIEDNIDAAETLKDVLELAGHEVRLAAEGPRGVFEARTFQPDVVLCDLGLPGMSGYDVARALRADESAPRSFLVALSGYASPEDALRSKEAGFDRHLAKPATTADLERILAEAPGLGARS